MDNCQIIGDSIAIGVGQQLAECRTVARIGITAEVYSRTYNNTIISENVLISLGSNGISSNLFSELTTVRSRIHAARVVWLLPANNQRAADVVRSIARVNGDSVLHVAEYVGRDGVHPTPRGYITIANRFANK